MVEYHGWFSITESLDGEYEENIDTIIEKLKSVVDKIYTENRIIALQAINGTYFLHLTGNTNHRSSDVVEVLELIKLIAEIAKGSYGLLYLRDDEDHGRDNEFVIYKMARGKIEEVKDTLLSPCNPTIEE